MNPYAHCATKKKGRTNNPYCGLDIPPINRNVFQQRTNRKRLGEEKVRQRAFTESSNGSSSSARKNDCYKDGSTVIYRRQEDWSYNHSYVNCIFLDSHDTVLAADALGRMDIIQLPRYSHGHGGSQSSAEDPPPRLMGTAFANDLSIYPPLKDFSTIKLKPIQSGHAFCVGMPSGDYHVLGTEQASTWGNKYNLRDTTCFSQSHSAIIARPDVSSDQSSYIQHAWTLQGPRRRYHRNRQTARLSLTHMMKNAHQTMKTASAGASALVDVEGHELAEIDEWGTERAGPRRALLQRVRFVPSMRPPNSSQWDFYETPSTLLAAKVDAEHDSFWLHVLDNRLPHTSHRDKSSSVVCVDTTSHDDRGSSCEEHVTSCTFASEYCLATAHVWCYKGYGWASASDAFDNRPLDTAETKSCIKLWDIRMVANRQPLHEVVLPSFPNDSTIGLEPTETLNTGVDLNDTYSGLSIGESTSSPLVITGLASSVKSKGTLLVTAQSRTQCRETEHYLLDLGRQKFTRQIKQTMPNAGLAPVFGSAASHNYMACVGGEANKPSIKVYNLHEEPLRTTTSTTTARSKKRTLDGFSGQGGGEQDDSWHSKFDPVLKDRHGLQTQLSCMAMNDSGIAILGGSNDGDLFVWRGT
jgi:hypothetical protein